MQSVKTKIFMPSCWHLSRWKYGKSRDELLKLHRSFALWVSNAFGNILTNRGLPACHSKRACCRLHCWYLRQKGRWDAGVAETSPWMLTLWVAVHRLRPCNFPPSTSPSKRTSMWWPECSTEPHTSPHLNTPKNHVNLCEQLTVYICLSICLSIYVIVEVWWSMQGKYLVHVSTLVLSALSRRGQRSSCMSPSVWMDGWRYSAFPACTAIILHLHPEFWNSST